METKRASVDVCPMTKVIELIGGKWKPLILYHLLTRDTVRFSELRSLIGNVTQKMLTTQLRSLESDGLIIRKVYAVVPPKVEYSLSERGTTLGPILYAMKAWGVTYVTSTPSPAAPPC